MVDVVSSSRDVRFRIKRRHNVLFNTRNEMSWVLDHLCAHIK